MFKLFTRTTPKLRVQTRQFKKTIVHLYQENPKLFKDAKVLMRVDFNVPFLNKDGKTISDDTRIREAIPTIKFLVDAGAKLILTSHCSRPKGMINETMRMFPMANRLSELIGHPVKFTSDCIGPEVDEAVTKLQAGDILMLENTRFYKNEEKNDPEFAQNLAKHADIYVNDSFGTAHRAHASTHGVCDFVGHKVAGLLMEKELNFLKNAVDHPVRPFGAIVGGAKVSSKIPVIRTLLSKCDKVFIGGGMIFTFYRAMGLEVGNSMVEEEFIPVARELMALAREKGVELILPSDVIVANDFKADAESKQVSINEIPKGWMGLDIGSQSLDQFNHHLSQCKTILWNGPMGVFEFDRFSKGTFQIAETLAQLTDMGATTIIGGGDSVAAVRKANLSERMSHISTGGGASLEMLEGKVLPGVEALEDV